jgi:hypothetical protein
MVESVQQKWAAAVEEKVSQQWVSHLMHGTQGEMEYRPPNEPETIGGATSGLRMNFW